MKKNPGQLALMISRYPHKMIILKKVYEDCFYALKLPAMWIESGFEKELDKNMRF